MVSFRSRRRRRLLRVVDVVFRHCGGPLRRRRRRITVVFPHRDVSVSRRPKNDGCFATKTPRHVSSSRKRLRREHHHHHRVRRRLFPFAKEEEDDKKRALFLFVLFWGKKWRKIPLLFFLFILKRSLFLSLSLYRHRPHTTSVYTTHNKDVVVMSAMSYNGAAIIGALFLSSSSSLFSSMSLDLSS